MPREAPIRRADGAATRLRIVRAAEALFSERGIDGVSLQEIGRAADQRNRSAVRYHFADKPGLLAAILDRHTVSIGAHRGRILDEIRGDGAERDLRRLAEAYVLPVAAKAEDPDGGIAFVRISAELIGHPSHSRFYFGRKSDRGASERLVRLVAAATPEVPRELLRPRTIAITGLLFHGIADWFTVTSQGGRVKRNREWRALEAHLVASVAALWALVPGPTPTR